MPTDWDKVNNHYSQRKVQLISLQRALLSQGLELCTYIKLVSRTLTQTRVALTKQLASVGWGVSFKALRTSCLALAFAPAKYCAPVWCRSVHTKHIDVPLNEPMRVITGCLRTIPPPPSCPVYLALPHLRQGAVARA